MDAPALNDVPLLWYLDGSLTDIYVLDTALDDWNRLLEIAQHYPFKYTYDGKAQALPSAQSIFEDRNGAHLLTFNVQGVAINCHFFLAEEVELDVDPKEITDAQRHSGVLEFVEALSRALGKGVRLTPESSPARPILSYDQAEGWLIHAQ